MNLGLKSNRGVHRILSQCSNRESTQADARYFLEKSQELILFQKKLDSSMKDLKSLDDSFSDQDSPHIHEEMAETYFARNLQQKIISTRCLLERQDKNNKIRLRSLPSEQLKSQRVQKDRSPRSPVAFWGIKSQQNINLPNLMFKAKKSKLPTNASKNRRLEYDYRDDDHEADDCTYEMIKIERRKL